MSEWILDVSTLNAYVKRSMEADPMLRSIRLRGEISNFRPNASGHWYFTLKDSQSRISCVMFRTSAMRTSFRPADGMSVILAGRVSLYEATGAYQFYADSMRPDGVGALYQQFEALKAKLQAEGLFDASRKRPIPYRPRRIAVITSRTGAVLHDIRRVAAGRDPGVSLVLLPVQVQGEGAAEEIAAALGKAGTLSGVDVIIVGRGGGSMEDLWAFNEEIVARAIARCAVPVISAVGHETDFTIADFAADRRAATPSNAAEIAVPDRQDMLDGLRDMRRHLTALMQQQLQGYRLRLARLRTGLMQSHPEEALLRLRERSREARMQLDKAMDDQLGRLAPRLAMAQLRLDSAADRQVDVSLQRLQRYRDRLKALNPEGVLQRGYALVLDGNRVLTSREQAVQVEQMTLRFSDGALKVKKEEDHGGTEKADL